MSEEKRISDEKVQGEDKLAEGEERNLVDTPDVEGHLKGMKAPVGDKSGHRSTGRRF